MKKIKRIVALVCAMVMMMAMSTVAFADNASVANSYSATIQINGIDNNAIVYAKQIIKDDPTKTTGWAFTDSAYATAFKNALNVNNDQGAISALSQKNNDSSEAATALNNITSIKVDANKVTLSDSKFTVNSAGLYLIEITDSTSTYTYNKMLAYVGFDESDKQSAPTSPIVVNAKKTQDVDTKELANPTTDKYVEIGGEISYKVTTVVPYIDQKDTVKNWKISDTLTGAHFKLSTEAGHTSDVALAVTVNGTATSKTYYGTLSADKKTFSVDLTDLAWNETTGRINENATVVITYTAIAEDTVISNIEKHTINNVEKTPSNVVNSYTATLNILKTDKDNNPLEDAVFVIKNSDNKYAEVEDGVLTGWSTTQTDKTKLTTDSEGKISVNGFDKDQTYTFLEIEAPTGYTVNDSAQNFGAWTNTSTPQDESRWYADGTLQDSPLVSLPMTGGMGTTLFTVIGVAIMVLAAALYLANKKKNAAN